MRYVNHAKKYDVNGLPYPSTLRSHKVRKDGTPYPSTRSAGRTTGLPFAGVDGEGGNVFDEGTLFEGEFNIKKHQYLSLRAGEHYLATGHPLTYKEIFSFLADLPRDHIWTAYFFDYDVTMMIRTLPRERAERLLHPEKRVSRHGGFMPVDVDEFQIDYLPHKEFRCRRQGQEYWTIISDAGQFFQSTFLKTLERWDIGTPEQRAMIKAGKEQRAEFGELTQETEEYNALECELHAELMEQFRRTCYDTGYIPAKWQGPGLLASAMLKKHGVPRRQDIPILGNKSFFELAQAGYYGGRFETTAAGPIHRRVVQWDINGAYVHMLKGLPCLIHGTWRRVRNRPDGALWFGKIHFNHPTADFLYNLPVRLKTGHIRYPKEGIGVYWSDELLAAERAGTVLDFQTGWVYETHCDCNWFSFVDDYYAERLRLGKSAKGYVLKLAGNSIYGKLAQSIGYAPWANPVWAGLITSRTRAMLIDAYRDTKESTLMLATDGIFTLADLDLPESKKLGEWEKTIHEDGIFIAQPGIYFSGDEPKSRGIERGRIGDMREDFENAWARFRESRGLDYTVSVPVDNFITARQAIARGKWSIAGTWEKATREISFDWSSKRQPGVSLRDPIDNMYRTIPYIDQCYDSVPYSRIIGGGLRVPDAERYTDPGLIEKARLEEQPDWVAGMLPRGEE